MTDLHTKDLGDVVGKIQKLLDLAARGGTAAEAEAAYAKATELLLKYNLSADFVEKQRGVDGRREQADVEGGFYSFHRELWKAVADLNFCVYWTQRYIAKDQLYSMRHRGDYIGKGRKDMERRRHAVVGRVANVKATIVMASYLIGAVERVLRERLSSHEGNMKSAWAWSFRRGALEQLVHKAVSRRREIADKEERVRAKTERAAKRAAGTAGISMSTALTVAAFTKKEEEANQDFIHGEGWSAEQSRLEAEAQVEHSERRRRMEEEYTKWSAANPTKARSEFEYKDKNGETWYYSNRSHGGRRPSGGTKNKATDISAFWAGSDAADSIGLDPQVDTGARKNLRLGSF